MTQYEQVLEEYNKTSKELDRVRRSKDKSEGAIEQLEKRLREEFGYDSEEEASSGLEEIRSELDSALERLRVELSLLNEQVSQCKVEGYLS